MNRSRYASTPASRATARASPWCRLRSCKRSTRMARSSLACRRSCVSRPGRAAKSVEREVPEELRKATSSVAVFNYWNLAPGKADSATPPALELDIETVKGAIDTR